MLCLSAVDTALLSIEASTRALHIGHAWVIELWFFRHESRRWRASRVHDEVLRMQESGGEEVGRWALREGHEGRVGSGEWHGDDSV